MGARALILYNAWLTANLSLARRYYILSLDEPVITVELIKSVFHRVIADSFSVGGGQTV